MASSKLQNFMVRKVKKVKNLMKSRRLKHYKQTFEFYIKTKPRADLELTVMTHVKEFVHLSHKYVLKEHTPEADIKRVDTQVQVILMGHLYKVNLHVHVHHYSSVYFDLHPYVVKLASVLQLPPNSIHANQPNQGARTLNTEPVKAQTPTSAFSS